MLGEPEKEFFLTCVALSTSRRTRAASYPSKLLACVSVSGVPVLFWIGIQPPNEKALPVTLIMVVVLGVAWWLGVRRIFGGPPVLSVAKEETQVPGGQTTLGLLVRNKSASSPA